MEQFVDAHYCLSHSLKSISLEYHSIDIIRVIFRDVTTPFNKSCGLEDMILVLSHSAEGMYNTYLKF